MFFHVKNNVAIKMKTLVIKPNYAETLGALFLSCHFETVFLKKQQQKHKQPAGTLSAGSHGRRRLREGRCPPCPGPPSASPVGSTGPGLPSGAGWVSTQQENRVWSTPRKSKPSCQASRNSEQPATRNGSHCSVFLARFCSVGQSFPFGLGSAHGWAQRPICV